LKDKLVHYLKLAVDIVNGIREFMYDMAGPALLKQELIRIW
jgi:hypothetical protein